MAIAMLNALISVLARAIAALGVAILMFGALCTISGDCSSVGKTTHMSKRVINPCDTVLFPDLT